MKKFSLISFGFIFGLITAFSVPLAFGGNGESALTVLQDIRTTLEDMKAQNDQIIANQSSTPTWEYRQLDFTGKLPEEQYEIINELGSEGWVLFQKDPQFSVFRRQK